jgi:hypothetical protein
MFLVGRVSKDGFAYTSHVPDIFTEAPVIQSTRFLISTSFTPLARLPSRALLQPRLHCSVSFPATPTQLLQQSMFQTRSQLSNRNKMARSRKRAAPTAASSRPAKKRKSAEASLAKMKEIADAEDAFSEDENDEFHAVIAVTNAADEESDIDMGETEDHDVVAAEALPVVAPGFRLWETTSKLASKGELTQTSKVILSCD